MVEFVSRAVWEKTVPFFFSDEKGKLILKIPEDVSPSEMDWILKIAGWTDDEKFSDPRANIPVNALTSFLFRKGMKTLAERMPFDALPRYAKNCVLDWKHGQKTLREALRIDTLRAELDAVRKTGDLALVSDKEFEIADKIQMAVRNYPFKLGAQQPSFMFTEQKINCRGGSVLGGSLLSEVGINFLLGDVPKHSILVLVTSDGTVEWHDMIAPWLNETLTDEKVSGTSESGKPLSVSDIVAYSKDPKPEGLMLDLVNDRLENPRSEKTKQRQFLTLFPPYIGLQMQILHGVAYELVDLAFDEDDPEKKKEYLREALLACKLSSAYDPKYEYAYNKMGEVFSLLGMYEDAVIAFLKSSSVNPENSFSYYGLGSAYFSLGMASEASAIFERYLSLADGVSDENWIKDVKKKMKKLSKKND